MSETREHALKNQALFWRAFAVLALRGKRTNQDFQSAALLFAAVGAPEDRDVEAIIREAQLAHGQGSVQSTSRKEN